MKTYPSDIQKTLEKEPLFFDRSRYVAPLIFQSRIFLLAAIAGFFSAIEAQTLEFIIYMDQLLAALLQPGVHPLLQAAAVKAIHESIPMTNRNRQRVESLFRGFITPMTDLTGDAFHPYLLIQVQLFFSKWYLRPADSVLDVIQDADKLKSNGGYSYRKKESLRQNSTPEEVTGLDLYKKRLSVFSTISNSVKTDDKLSIFGQSLFPFAGMIS